MILRKWTAVAERLCELRDAGLATTAQGKARCSETEQHHRPGRRFGDRRSRRSPDRGTLTIEAGRLIADRRIRQRHGSRMAAGERQDGNAGRQSQHVEKQLFSSKFFRE